jgi:fibronectin-binding autotransporter adhesin
MSRRHNLRRWLQVNTLDDRICPTVTTWVGGTMGSANTWELASNWNNGVPGLGDTAVFQSANTLSFSPTLSAATSIGGLSMTGTWNGQINVNNTLTLTGTSSWVTGNIDVSSGTSLINSGTMTLTNGGSVALFGTGTLSNKGTITQAGAGSLFIDEVGTTLDTPSGGLYDLQSDTQVTWSGSSGNFTNEGTLRRSTGIGNADLITNFTLAGTVDVQSGTLRLAPQGTGTVSGAALKVSSGATLVPVVGSVEYVGTITGTGAGTINHSGGTMTVSTGATFNFTTGLFQWTGGNIDVLANKTLTNAAGSFMTLSNAGAVALYGTGTLSNQGTIAQAGTANLFIDDVGTTLDTPSGGVYDLQSDTQVTWSGSSGNFTNEGTLRRSAGSKTASLLCNFTITNAIDVQAGTLAFAPASTTGTVTDATATVNKNAVLDLTGGSTTNYTGKLTGVAGAGGLGQILLSGGTLVVPAAATFSFPNGMFQWTGGNIQVTNGNSLTNPTGSFMTLSNAGSIALFGTGTLTNKGTITQAGAGSLFIDDVGTTLDTPAGGLFDLQSDSQVTWSGNSGNFTNEGTLRRSVGTNNADLVTNFTLSGTVDVQSGTLRLAPQGTGTVSGAALRVSSGATLVPAVGTVEYVGTITGTGAGTINHSGGTMTVSTGATFNFTTGLFQWTGGNIQVLANKTLINAAGSFMTLSNGGSVALFGTGTLTNKGTITQAGAGSLFIDEVGTTLDTPSGGLYDLQSDTQVTWSGSSGIFTNEGTLRRSTGIGNADLITNFTLAGTVDVQSGTLRLAPQGTGTVSGAALKVSSGATLVPVVGSVEYVGTITGTGAGTINHSGGTMTVSTGATFNFTTGLFQWTGGNIDVLANKTLTNAAGSFMTLSNAGAVALYGTGTLSNQGTIAQAGTANLFIDDVGTTLDTPSGGVYDLQSDTQVTWSGSSGNFTNEGTLRRSAGSKTASLLCNFTITNAIDVQAGTLAFAPASTTGTVTDATATVNKNAVLDLTGGSTTNYTGKLTGVAGAGGLGQILLSGGTLVVPAVAIFSFPNGMFQWTGGNIQVTKGNSLTNATGSFMTLSNAGSVALYGGGTLSNKGTINQAGTGNLFIDEAGTTLDTPTGGVYDLQSDTQVTWSGVAGNFTNEGTFRRSTGMSNADLVCNFTLAGTVDVQSGTLGLYPQGAAGTVNGATLKVASGATLVPAVSSVEYVGTITGAGAGTINLSIGNLTVNTGATFNFPAGLFQWTGGNITVAKGAMLTNATTGVVTLNNGGAVNLSGDGTLINFGLIRQTGSGNLNVNGATTLVNDGINSAGVYDIQSTGGLSFSGSSGTVSTSFGGLLRKSVNVGTATVSTKFDNGGGIDVQTGNLKFSSGLTLAGFLEGVGTLSGGVKNSSGFVEPGEQAVSPGILTITDGYTQSGGSLYIRLNGTTLGTQYDQLVVNGPINLQSSAALSVFPGYSAKVGDSFVILHNADNKAINGTFAGHPDGSEFTVGKTTYQIAYEQKSGSKVTGNDITLTVTKVAASLIHLSAVGSGQGGDGTVQVYASNGKSVFAFQPYSPSFHGGVRVATADVDGDGVEDLITGAGPGGGPHVQVFSGAKLLQGSVAHVAGPVASFFAYDAGFQGGVFVAAADVNGDGKADIITGAGAGGGPHVIAFDSVTGDKLASFFAYDSAFRGGVNVAGGDLNGDGKAEIVTGAGPGGGPHVRAFDVAAGGKVIRNFFAYDAGFTGGVNVAVGDINGDGQQDIVTGAGAGGGPQVKVFDGGNLALFRSFYAYNAGFTGGVRVAVGQFDAQTGDTIITGAGTGGGPHVRFVASGNTSNNIQTFYAFDPSFLGGVFVG